MNAIYRTIVITAGLLLAATGVRAQSNFTQLYPGISFAGIQSDLQNMQGNTNYSPTNLLAFMRSNYSGVLPRETVWTFDASTQNGTNNGSMYANGKLISAPAEPVQIVAPQLGYFGGFTLTFATVSNHSYTVYGATNPASTNWTSLSNIIGNGYLFTLTFPTNFPQQYFRVSQP
jgi:hypothetical protein